MIRWITLTLLLVATPAYAQWIPQVVDGKLTAPARRMFEELVYEQATSDTVMIGWEEALSHTDTKGTRNVFAHNTNTDMMYYGPDSYAMGDFYPKVQGFFWHSCGRGGQAGCWQPNGTGGSEMDFDVSYKDFMLRRGWEMGIIPVISLDMYHPNIRTAGSTGTKQCMDTTSCNTDTQCDGGGGSPIVACITGGSQNAWCNGELDKIATYLLQLQQDGKAVILRILWEFTQEVDWFGCECNTIAQMKSYFQYIVEYLRDTKGVHNVLYMWSPQPLWDDVNQGASKCSGTTNLQYMEAYPGDSFVDIINCEAYMQFLNDGTNNLELDATGSQGGGNTVRYWLRDCYDNGQTQNKISTYMEGNWNWGESGSCPGASCEGVNDTYWTDFWNDIYADPKLKHFAFIMWWWTPHWGPSRVRNGYERYDSNNAGAIYSDATDFRNYATMDSVNVIRRKKRIF